MGAVLALRKACTACGKEKPATLDFFHANGGCLYPRCKDCRHVPGTARRKVDTRSLESQDADPQKQCARCETWKLKDQFSPDTRYSNSLRSYCRACVSFQTNVRSKARLRLDWAARVMAYVRTSYAGSKRRKKVLTWAPHDLDKAFLWELLASQKGRCYWTNLPLSLEEMGKPWSVSLDRLDCDRGYTKDNVVLVSMSANLARNDASPDDMRAFIELIRRS